MGKVSVPVQDDHGWLFTTYGESISAVELGAKASDYRAYRDITCIKEPGLLFKPWYVLCKTEIVGYYESEAAAKRALSFYNTRKYKCPRINLKKEGLWNGE